MYINATGANPTGVIIPLERRKEIYRLACEYDFLILDDDPYCFLNYSDVSINHLQCYTHTYTYIRMSPKFFPHRVSISYQKTRKKLMGHPKTYNKYKYISKINI